MMRSLFAGVSGLKSHQTRMDVIGNNIANVNTIGFKGSRVNFQDVLNQTLQSASAAQGNRGGTNPMQVGLGTGVASIDTIFTDGSYQTTGKQTDLSIQGQGFFVVSDGLNQYYTRAGNFDFDVQGNYLIPGTGLKVVGWMADSDGVINTSSTPGNIQVPVGATMPAKATTSFSLVNNLSADDEIGSIVPAGITIYDSLGNAHKLNQTFVKVSDNKWISTSTFTDGTITGGAITEITFDSEGKLSSVNSVVPQVTAPSSLEIGTLQLNNANPSTQVIDHTIVDTNGVQHTFRMTITNVQSWADGATDGQWNYTIVDLNDPAMAPINGIITYPATAPTPPATREYTGFPIDISYRDGGVLKSIPLNHVGGSVDPANNAFVGASTTTYTTIPANPPTPPTTTSLTINNLQLDNTLNSVSTVYHTVFDSSGVPHVFKMEFTNTQAWDPLASPAKDGTWKYKITDLSDKEATPVSGTISYDGATYNGFPSSFNYKEGSITRTVALNLGAQTPPVSGSFVADSTLPYTTGPATELTIVPNGSANTMSINQNFNSLTQYGGESTIQAANGDGYAAGTLDLAKLTIDQNGVIIGGFTNGRTQKLAQIALAVFNNPSGLNKVGQNMYAVSTNSGDPQIGIAGAGGRGTFTGGTLEMSNVDLAQQFSDMIITQRGFQANSKIITTTDEMLELLANLKR